MTTIILVGVLSLWAASVSALPMDEDNAVAAAAAPGDTRFNGQMLSALLNSTNALGQELGQEPERPVYSPEEPCSRHGGMCMPSGECPAGKAAPTGLCPRQRYSGVECCYGISMEERRCRYRGGECRADKMCNPNLRDESATDCPAQQVCCVIVSI